MLYILKYIIEVMYESNLSEQRQLYILIIYRTAAGWYIDRREILKKKKLKLYLREKLLPAAQH